ncbi:MAG: hypothetical protein M1833_003974 [Piccolia ochrophora]|nr:MAG: hypothetical protein M1833_003974 [Piccolia ochrophora]
MLALTGCTGKIGGAILQALLEYRLLPPTELVVCTSSDPNDSRWDSLKAKGITVLQSNFNDPESMVRAFSGCSSLLLVSSPEVSLDFNDAPAGNGRERHHINAINAAQVAGVQHIYYTSLAFGAKSGAGVMRAHLHTEAFLERQKITSTVIREGLYNESWPLYFGFYDLEKDNRDAVLVAGDGPISWTSIDDLGFATASILAAPSTAYAGQTLYLSSPTAITLEEVARIISNIKGMEIELKVVSREEYCKFYAEKGVDKAMVEWWSTTYGALEQNECLIKDGTVTRLLSSKGSKPKSIEDTIREML